MERNDFTAEDLSAVIKIIENIDQLDPELDSMTINRKNRTLGNIRKTQDGWVFRPAMVGNTGSYFDR